MEAKLRKSLIPVLVALMLMMLCCEGLPRAQQTLAEDILLGQRDGYALYALADAPQGEERFFDSDTLYQGELLYVSPGHPLDSQRTRQQARNVRHMVCLGERARLFPVGNQFLVPLPVENFEEVLGPRTGDPVRGL